MRRPEQLSETEYGHRPNSEEVREHARELVKLSVELVEFADWVDRGKDVNPRYWNALDQIKRDIMQEVMRFRS